MEHIQSMTPVKHFAEMQLATKKVKQVKNGRWGVQQVLDAAGAIFRMMYRLP